MTLIRRAHNNYNYPVYPSFFDNLFSRDLMDWNNLNFSETETTIPAANVKENADKYEIDIAAPGMKKDDFKVKVDGNLLTISSSRREEKESEGKDKINRREFSYQSFQRSFTLPDRQVQVENIAAKYDNGILHIELPKREEVKPQPLKEIKIL